MRYLLVILIMGVISQLSRITPLFITSNFKFSKRVNKFLSAVPYAALGVMIFPGILSVGKYPIVGLAGGVTAVILTYLKVNIIVIIAASVAVVAALNSFV
ncbi:AzlD domain-containing protein [Clostridium sp. YIM B02551]|uniref:AzlD domain-containing protein n=1 Tax=Clostridium sp. YIM B02551 TaxID=2910679 RepID=UPI001EEA1810|nr:AzlD domain-containing protein [Clostridium sp. YIM B02551]